MNSIISCFGWWKWSLELEWRRMVDSDLPPSPNDFLFPPIDHENLQIASQTPPSPPSPQPFDSRLRGWISISFHILRSKLSSLMQRGPIWSIGLPSAALLMSCWIFISIRKKITLTPNEARLVNIIKDKDRVRKFLLFLSLQFRPCHHHHHHHSNEIWNYLGIKVNGNFTNL